MSLSKSDSKTKIDKEKSSSQREISNSEIIAGSGSCSDELKSNKSYEDGSLGLEEGEDGKSKTDDHLPKLISYREMLDAPRELPEPVDITFDYLKLISEELGLIKLCWPDLIDATFEDRTNFPESYLKNNNKEKLLLLYAENFRRQFCFRYPDRKPLLLACDNECGMQTRKTLNDTAKAIFKTVLEINNRPKTDFQESRKYATYTVKLLGPSLNYTLSFFQKL